MARLLLDPDGDLAVQYVEALILRVGVKRRRRTIGQHDLERRKRPTGLPAVSKIRASVPKNQSGSVSLTTRGEM